MIELDLTSYNLNDLRNLAKENGFKNIAKFRKQELIDMLTEKFNKEEELEEKEKNIKENSKAKVPDSKNIESKETASNKTASNSTESKNSKNQNDEKNSKTEQDKKNENKFLTATGVELVEKITKKESSEDNNISKPTEKDSRNIKENRENPLRDNNQIRENINRENSSEEEVKSFPPDTTDVFGVLEIQENNSFGFLRGSNYLTTPDDTYVSPAQIRRFRLKTGDFVRGKSRPGREGEKFRALIYVDSVNDETPDKAMRRPNFDALTPVYPNERLFLEVPSENDLTTRIMDILSPIGKGQRGLIVAPPKAGKTTMLKRIAKNLVMNNKGIKLIVLLIDERPEEVTDMKESVDGEVIYSTFDEEPTHHAKVAEMVLERAKRMVEQGQDVVILLDSLTRLSRAYNLTVTPSGRTLSGGLDPASLIMPKKFFGAARNIRKGGSLTILATALIDTGSRMDDMVFEEFKGTGNMEVHLDRKLQERRIFPAIDIYKSGTRKEELLLNQDELEVARKIRRLLYKGNDTAKVTGELISMFDNTETNETFIDAIKAMDFKLD